MVNTRGQANSRPGTQPGSRDGSRPNSSYNSPNKKPRGFLNKAKALFGKLKSYHDVEDSVRFEQQRSAPFDTRNPDFIKQYQTNLIPDGTRSRDSMKSAHSSRSIDMRDQASGAMLMNATRSPPQQANLRHTTAIFDLPNQGMSKNLQGPQSGASGNFNIFEHFQNQAQQNRNMAHSSPFGGAPFNLPQQNDPHQMLFNQPSAFQSYPYSMQNMPFSDPQAQNPQNQSQPGITVVDPFGITNNGAPRFLSPNNSQQLSNSKDLSKSNSAYDDEVDHTKIREDTSTTGNSARDLANSKNDLFHGKSMRSIQLFNQPTSANPHNLHPSQNPMVKVESPKKKNQNFTLPQRAKSSLLDIHADSCYNFLNKRRYKVSPHDLTPLEAFFLKESLNQHKVSLALQQRPANLQPSIPPPVPRRTKRYLLVLDIDETLVHSEPMVVGGRPTQNVGKSYDHTLKFENPNGSFDVYGVRNRPFLTEFIQRMSKLYDLAVYTASAKDYADAVMDKIDPNRTIFCARLYREHCFPVNGMNIKNLENFSGPDVFIVDNLIYSYAYHSKQGIPICAFVDDPMDVELQDLAEILENLPYYESLPSLLDDLLGLDEFYRDLSGRLTAGA